jgi:hypothetical protein
VRGCCLHLEFFLVGITKIVHGLALFADTKVGKVITALAGIVLVFTTVMMAGVIATNLFSFAAGKAAVAADEYGLSLISAAFIEGGFIAGTLAAAAAVWALLLPLLPFIAAGLLLIGVFYGMYEGVKSFNEMAEKNGEKLRGIAGVFQKSEEL